MSEVLERLQQALADRYRLERELGAGGMATVYLAEDLKHHRHVAVKVLRPEIARALGAERFLREIETTARLTHPHILPLLDSGDADGTLYYVMPFVEGESLRDRLAREHQLPLDDAVRITREVADALGYAHGHGVVHRDIKPENILLESGHAVVADFGIARAIDQAAGERLTETGVTLGTPAYMSPEQATGSRDLDGRSDVYSLACMLYEMLAAETPYTGPTPMAIMARKLADPLPRISVVRETVPPAVEAVLTKALARLPVDRYQTAGEFAEALARAGEPTARVLETGRRVTRSGATTSAYGRSMGALGRLPRAARWTAALAGAAALVVLSRPLLAPGPLGIRVSDVRPLTTEPGIQFQPTISPDGKMVAYVAGPLGAPHLVIRSAAGTESAGELLLADTSFTSENLPQWRADGEAVRFWGCRQGDCLLYETGKLGGPKRPVTLPGHPGDRYAWSRDGSRVAFVHADTIFTWSQGDTGALRIAVHTRDFWGLHSLAWSPDGRFIAYVSGNADWRSGANVAGSSIWLVSATGGEPRQITTGDRLNVSPAWIDDRHLLFVSNRDGPRGVYAVAVDPSGADGEPQVVPSVADPHSISYSIASRTLTFAKFSISQNIWAYPIGSARPVSIRLGQPVTTGRQIIEEHDVSRDGRWLAFDNASRGNMRLFRMPVAGGDAVPLTDEPWDDEGPRWSPDGTEIAFYVGRAGTWSVWAMPSQGGAPSRLSTDSNVSFSPIWSPDGLRIAYVSRLHGRPQCSLALRDRVGGPWRASVHLTEFPCYAGDWTYDGGGFVSSVGAEQDPDAATLVLVTKDGRVTRRALPAASRLRLTPSLRYSRDGRTIYGIGKHEDGRNGVWAISATGAGEPKLAIAFDDSTLVPLTGGAGSLSVSADRIYLTVARYDSDIWVAKLRW